MNKNGSLEILWRRKSATFYGVLNTDYRRLKINKPLNWG